MKNFSVAFQSVDDLTDSTDILNTDTKDTLIQLFCAHSDEIELFKIQQYFKNNYPNSVIIGTTTDGIVENTNVYNASKNVATFTIFEKTSLKCALVKNEECQNDSYEVGKTIANKLLSEKTRVIISFADGINTNGEEYVNGITQIAPEVTLSGGLAADNGQLVKTYVFNKHEITSSGAVAVCLEGENLNVSTNYTFDWLPIGKKMVVTKAIKNRIYEIDGISAVDIYAKYFGEKLARRLPQVGIEFPLIFEKDGMSIGRDVLFKHEDDSLTLAGNISQGTEVRFGVGSAERILQNSHHSINTLLDKLKYEPEGVFMYSCMARRRFMSDNISAELKILNKLGKVTGFFTYGEFFHSHKNNQLLNETMTLLVLSENNKTLEKRPKERVPTSYDYVVKTEHVVANLANVVSNELAELNENLEKRIKESSSNLYRHAYYDDLTGLPNRKSLIEKIENFNEKILFLINIDDFTTINDFYGYKIGDLVLSKLAIFLQELVKNENATLYKLSADEFAVIMDKFENRRQQEKMIKRHLAYIEEQNFVIDYNDIHVSVTIAVSNIEKDGNALANADMALKLAKRAHKNSMIFTEDLNLAKKSQNNLAMVKMIKTALAKDGIVPYFQPLLNMKTGKIDKYESLVRLRQEDGKVLSPFEFLQISEKVKLYPYITHRMIEKTFAYFKKNGFSFSLNLSFDDISDKKRMQFLFAMIYEYEIASQLTIEILETQENDDAEAVIKFTKDIYDIGAKIAIDDFGSGYANFEHMTTIESTFMKIDGSLIKNLDKDKNAKLIVETIISFAKKLDKKIIAEYVHSKEVYDVVKDLGVDYMQGYYIGEPLEHTL
jgi:diguanylate cyclase (GGDEF)-like protein